MKYETASPDIYPLLRAFARENRKNATVAERVLWEHIRHDALGYHAEPRQKADDELRTGILEGKGYKVIRFSNEDVLYDTDMTINKIKEALRHE